MAKKSKLAARAAELEAAVAGPVHRCTGGTCEEEEKSARPRRS